MTDVKPGPGRSGGPAPDQIQKKTLLDLEIIDLAYGGNGVAKVRDFVVFVEQAVPGDVVRARVTRRQKNHAEAVVEEIVTPSPNRVTPPCPLFGTCGGCTWQNIPYSEQLRHKERQACSVLEHLGKARPERIEPIIPSPLEWRYRNKMDFTFGTDAAGRPMIGFHRSNQFHSILEVPACLLQPEEIDRLLGAITQWARRKNLTSYEPRTHQGFLRHLVVRHSVARPAN